MHAAAACMLADLRALSVATYNLCTRDTKINNSIV